jgi:vesicle-fusing ATPase
MVVRILLLLLLLHTTATAFTSKYRKAFREINYLSFIITRTQQSFLLENDSSRKATSLNIVINADNGADVNSESSPQSLPLNDVNNRDNIGNALDVLVGNAVDCLIQSDLKRKGGKDGGSTGWTSWIDDASAYRLKCCMDAIALTKPDSTVVGDHSSVAKKTMSSSCLMGDNDNDQVVSWLRWMRAVPSPLFVDLSETVRCIASRLLVNDYYLEMVESTREEFLERIVVNLILLPSGKSLECNIRTPPGAMAYGKLLYGGATRYRLLPGKMKRRTGERTAIMTGENDNVMSWSQYGGPERNYEAVDMGPCAILEVILLPKGLVDSDSVQGQMCLYHLGWELNKLITFWTPCNQDSVNDIGQGQEEKEALDGIMMLNGKERNDFMMEYFTQNVGGLQAQIESIVRRVLDGRVYRSFDDIGEIIGSDQSFLEAKELESLGLTSIRGLLLYGPPGCGKTVLAREISKALKARNPKVVSAPELLDRWVGGSEKLIRGLFEDAEAELRACGGDPTKSSLHVIVIDEIDAVFRKRSSAEDSASATRASAVNQILAKLDGVNAIPNVLLIGMTNRRELLDEALLRPGRLEVQVEIPLPTKEGRREIFRIHFGRLRKSGRLSESLCRAIDGPVGTINLAMGDESVSVRSLFRSRIKAAIKVSRTNIRDLAADSITGGFSGADIAGLVRCAGSIALARTRAQGMGIDSMIITLDDVAQALSEVKR